MNSSTKPPISQTRKFQFDNDFEVENERMKLEALRRQEQEETFEETEVFVPAPVFSEEELQQACRDALEQGIQQGREEAKHSVENILTSLTGNALVQLENLVSTEHERNQLAEKIALHTTIATIKKIWPSILKQFGLSLVEDTIRQSMEYNNEEQRIVIRVHDTMLDAVIKSLPQLQEQAAFAGKVIVIADQGVIAGDCKIEWADGGMERLSRTLSQQLDTALERLLSTLNSSQNADPERTSK